MKSLKCICISLAFILSIILTVCIVSKMKIEKPSNVDTTLLDDYVQLVDENHIVHTLSGEEVISKIHKGESFVLMMGFKPCPWCQALMPHYNATAKEFGLEAVYYLDILDMRNNPDSPDRIYYDALYVYCKEALDVAHDRIGAPTTIVVKDGKLVGFNIGTVEGHDRVGGVLPPLTDDQIVELHKILMDLYSLL